MIFIAWLATTMLTPAYIKAASRLQCVEDEAAFILYNESSFFIFLFCYTIDFQFIECYLLHDGFCQQGRSVLPLVVVSLLH